MIIYLLQWFLSIQTSDMVCKSLPMSPSLPKPMHGHGHFSSQAKSDKLVRSTSASPRRKSYVRVVSTANVTKKRYRDVSSLYRTSYDPVTSQLVSCAHFYADFFF